MLKFLLLALLLGFIATITSNELIELVCVLGACIALTAFVLKI